TTPRKLLASRKQIDQLEARKKDGLTIVPTKLLTTKRYIKLVIALGKGKKKYDKRETLKRRDQERDAKRIIKHQ
ncbi:MAG: SsrA-binding protein, partial [Candidatus Saccharimonadales bacterium]